MATISEWDYSIQDANDDTGVHDNNDNSIVGDDEIYANYYDNIPAENLNLGYGWFDTAMASLHNNVDLTLQKFVSKPRSCDRRPSDVPAQHPIRAIAQVLHRAPEDSIVRIYCYALSDPFVLDLLTHHGEDKIIKIIMHPCERSVTRIKEFLDRFKAKNSHQVFYLQIQLRIANTNQAGCSRYTQMHDKRLMTSEHCLYGSYNLTPVARCANWESMALSTTSQQEIEDFDSHWNNLQGREIEKVFPPFYPKTFRVAKRQSLS